MRMCRRFHSTDSRQRSNSEFRHAGQLRYLAAEEDRLLYVAATRARELLFVCRWTGNHKNKAWGVLNDFLARAKELTVPESATAQSVEPLDCSNDAQARSNVLRVAALVWPPGRPGRSPPVTARPGHMPAWPRPRNP